MSVRRIVQSVLQCKFDEGACSAVEQLASTNLEAGLQILDGLEHSELSTQSETFSSAQVAVYLAYIYRFVQAYGHERVPPSYKTSICQFLDTKDSELAEVIVLLAKLIMPKDEEICEFVFHFHFKQRENPLPLRVITEYADQEGKHFFGKLNEFLVDKSTQFYALELLGKIINNQGGTMRHLRDITETPCLNSLLGILETEETLIVVLSLAIRILVMLLPFIPSSLPPLLDKLFAIVTKLTLISWKNTHQPLSVQFAKDLKDNQQMGSSVGLLVVYLYGMFPCSFVEYLRLHDDKRLKSVMKPLLSKLRFNINLTYGKGNELALERWKNRDSHDIVAECMGFYDFGQDGELIDYMKQQLISQQKLLSAHESIREPNPAAQDRFFNAAHKQEKMWLLYLLHQYQQRAAHLGREVMLTRARADEALSANTRIPLLDTEIASLNEHTRKQANESTKALAQANSISMGLIEKMKKLKEENEALVSKCGSLVSDAAQLETARIQLVEEVNDKSERLVEFEMRLQDAYDELSILESENAKMSSLNEDLLLWKDQQINKVGEKDMQLLQEEIEEKEESIEDLVDQLEIAHAQVDALHENYQQAQAQLQQLEQEKAQWQEQMAFARNMLEKQRLVDAAKLKSVEEKYTSVKSLYLGVEKRMFELRSENDKAKR